MLATQPAPTTVTTLKGIDIVDEAIAIVAQSVSSTVTNHSHRATACGCRGCKAQAVQAAEWAAHMYADAA
jgi:hypothetical protein